MAAAEGVIFQVQRWSIHDGEGIRSTVFLKGCPLRCAWCANPESWSPKIEHGFGQLVTVEELMRRLRRDEVFYRESGGGVTFSGGEPLMQADFLLAAVQACAASGYHTAIETSLMADWEKAWPILGLIDEIFIDLKHMDHGLHCELTGVSNKKILENAQKLLAVHNNVTVRVPLVEGLNDDKADLEALAAFLENSPGFTAVEFMPYHNLGVAKYARLNLPEPPIHSSPSAEAIDGLKRFLRRRGLNVL
ncbi:glycyl-radical enzyme activating protein [Deltaproteobacteria bacterium Smac51]|nr:glycyl-radical enzyme activating protein [Deltaproteobacteria bacterium Smac51]